MGENKIKVVIADDHKLFRKGMRALLGDFGFVIVTGEAENGIELLELLRVTDVLPDIILLDLRMPLMDGVEAYKEIKKLYPSVKVIVLTMEDDEQYILHLIGEGVNGYLLKNAETAEVETSIRKVTEEGYYYSDAISGLVMKNLKKRKKTETVFNPEFTDRELEVLELICKENSNAEIAKTLNVSIRTVEGYRMKLTEKSGAKNIAGLVVLALKYKWVSL